MKVFAAVLIWLAIVSIIGQFVIELWKLFRGGKKSGDLPPGVWHARFDSVEEKVDKLRIGQANMKVDLKELKQPADTDIEIEMKHAAGLGPPTA